MRDELAALMHVSPSPRTRPRKYVGRRAGRQQSQRRQQTTWLRVYSVYVLLYQVLRDLMAGACSTGSSKVAFAIKSTLDDKISEADVRSRQTNLQWKTMVLVLVLALVLVLPVLVLVLAIVLVLSVLVLVSSHLYNHY